MATRWFTDGRKGYVDSLTFRGAEPVMVSECVRRAVSRHQSAPVISRTRPHHSWAPVISTNVAVNLQVKASDDDDDV